MARRDDGAPRHEPWSEQCPTGPEGWAILREATNVHALALTALLIAPPAPGGEPPAPTETKVEPPALTYHRHRTLLGMAGMGALTGWAVGNIATGIAGTFSSSGPARYFHQSNAAWNTVNLALGIWGMVGQHRESRSAVDLTTGRARARRAQQVFGINAGLDVLYVGTGAVMWSVAQGRAHDRLQGYGQSLVLQGSFLFAFDVGMMLGHEWLIDHYGRDPSTPWTLRPTAALRPEGGLMAGITLRPR